MQNDGEAGQTLTDLLQNVETELGVLAGLEFICAVGSADGDCKGVDSRAGGKLLHFVGRGKQRVLRFHLYVVLHARQLAELGLDDYAAFVRVLDDFFRQGDIFLPGLGRSVDHYGGKSAVDGRLADFEIGAVVEVHDDGNICRFHSGLHEVAKIDGVGVLSRACGNLQNHGSLHSSAASTIA